jgi:hypothetical protein
MIFHIRVSPRVCDRKPPSGDRQAIVRSIFDGPPELGEQEQRGEYRTEHEIRSQLEG